jgi:peptidylprolyl isomerase
MTRLWLAAVATAWTASAWAQTPAGDLPVARRGALTLTAGEVANMVRFADPALRHQLDTDPAALARYVRDRMVALAVLDDAHAHGWDSRPDIAWRADRAREASIIGSYLEALSEPDPSYPSEAEVQDAYQANKARLMVPRQYHLAQIFVASPPGTQPGTPADAAAEKRLLDLRAQIAARHGDFAGLARRQSEDRGSAANGGDLGWVREDQLLPAVRAAVAGLAEGSLSPPIRAADGWHLVRLLDTRPAGPAPLADVRAQLVQALRQQKQQENARAYIAGLLRQAPVQLDEIQLSASVPKLQGSP